ncbi:MAG: choice-of-anchor Q domain-containing protein [Pirellulaceae bacterium]
MLSAQWPLETGLPQDVAGEWIVRPGETLSGNQTIVGNVVNRGVLSPGNSPGIITIDGDLVLDASDSDIIDDDYVPSGSDTVGTIQIEIGGLNPGPGTSPNTDDGHDQIRVTGNVFLGGTCEIVLINNFQPEVGQTFDILTAADFTGKFDDAVNLVFTWAYDEIQLSYFAINVVDNASAGKILQLEVKQMPGQLEYKLPSQESQDELGEFLNDSWVTTDSTTFMFSGSISVPGFAELSGSFSLEKAADGSQLTMGASNIRTFLGTGGDSPETTDDLGLEINGANLGAVVFTPQDGPSSYALTAEGSVALVGLDGLEIGGSVAVQANTTGTDVLVGDLLVEAGVQAFQGGVAVTVGGAFHLDGELSATKTLGGAVLLDIPNMNLRIELQGEEVFGIGGGARFSIGGDDGFRMLDMGLNSITVFGATLPLETTGSLPNFAAGGGAADPDEFAVELTSLPGLSVDANLLNRRKYIDVTYVAPAGTDVDHEVIDASDFTLAGTGVADVEVDFVELLAGSTFRYHLRDKDTSNEESLFVAGEVVVGFAAGSWANDQGVPSPEQTFAVTVRDGTATGTSITPMSLGPLAIAGPHLGIEDFQFKKVSAGAHLTITVGIGANLAFLDFGGGQSSSGVTVQLTDLLGTFELGADVGVSGLENVTGAFGFQVGQLRAEVPDVMIVTASDVDVTHDPRDKTVGKEMIHVGWASIEIPKVGVTGEIEELSVRNDGFSVGTAELTKDGTFNLNNILELTNVTVGVTDFGVTFGQAVDFDGTIFIASAGAKLFPGKAVSASISDADDDGEAVRCALTFTDGRVDGFQFSADQLELQFGSYLTITGSDILIDTGAGPTEKVASFASLGAELSAGPLKLFGEMRHFAFLGDSSFQTGEGFGVFFNRDTADSQAFKWPSWLPIRITSVGAKWKDINADPTDFQVTLSAAVTGLHKLPLKVSGAIEGVVIDVGLLLDGKFPVTAMESLTVGVEGKLFGGEVQGALLGGIVRIGVQDNELVRIPPEDTTTPVEDRVLFVGLDAGFSMAGVGGFGLKMAFSELGPLGVMITASTPTGILLEPTTGLTINDFVAGVEFFKTLPALTEPEQLRDQSLATAADIDSDSWLASVQDQVVAQYSQIQENPNQAGFLAAFTEPMTITAGAKIYSLYTSEYTFNGQVELRLSTDGKFLATGQLNFFDGALSLGAKLYANLSEIAQGSATVLLLADVPEQFRLLVVEGKFQMGFQDAGGQPIEFDFADADATSALPVANLASPSDGSTLGLATLTGRGYLDVSYRAKGAATLDAPTVMDDEAEFNLRLVDGTLVPVTGQPVLVSDPATAPAIYRYQLPAEAVLVPGEIEIQFIPGSFADSDGRTNEADTETFRLSVPEADLTLPADGGVIDLRALNDARYITVRFRPTPGATFDLTSLEDAFPEIQLIGDAATSVLLQAPIQVGDTPFFQYPFEGQFGTGTVQVNVLAGSFAETDGLGGPLNTNVEAVQSFTVVGPTVRLVDRSVDVAQLNSRKYLDVRYDAGRGATLDVDTITDLEAEFTLSGSALVGAVTVDGVPTNPSGDGVTWRYAITGGQFQPGELTLEFGAGTWSDTLDALVLDNLAEIETLTVLGPTVELLAPQAGMAGVALSSIDLKFRPTWGHTLNESNVPQFTLSGSAVPQGVTLGNPTSLGDGVYRYTFSGGLRPGALALEFAAGAVQDSSVYASLAQTEVVTIVGLTARLAYPLAGSRVSAQDVNHLDVTFADPLGLGLNEISITDAQAEISLWTKDDQGQETPISGVNFVGNPTEVSDHTYRYGFSGELPAGSVIVKYAAGSWTDMAGNPGSGGEEAFLATRTAATLSIDVSGSVELFAGSEDRRLLGISGGVSMRAEIGSRVTVDMHGQIDLMYLGTVGASAGRFVLDADEAGMWGALRIDTNFEKLEGLGIQLDAYCLLEVNTTDQEKSETLTLAGQAKGGGDLTREFVLGPQMFRIEAAGVAALHVPPLLHGGDPGPELARVSGALLLDVRSDGLEAFADGEISFGPPELGVRSKGQGVLIINDDGFAAEVVITRSFELGPVMQSTAKAHVTINVTEKTQSVELPEEMHQYLPPDTLASLIDGCYTVPAGAPQRDGSIGDPGAYLVVGAEGQLMIAEAFRLEGDFWMELSEEQFLLDANASLELGLIGSLQATGILIVDVSGVRARVTVDGQLGGEQLGLTLAEAHGHFELNTTSQNWDVFGGGTIVVPAGSMGVVVDVGINFPGFAEGEGTAAVTYVDGGFRLFLDGQLHIGELLNLDVYAYVGIFDAGVIIDAAVDFDLNLVANILDVDVAGRLQVNTTDSPVSSYATPVLGDDGNITYQLVSCVDANGNPKELLANSFHLDVKGDLELLGGILTIGGQLIVDAHQNDWTIEVPSASVNFFGIGTLNVNGAFSSEGEFQLHVSGGVRLGVKGCGLFGSGSLDVSRLDSNGFGAGGDGHFVLAVSGYFYVRVELFHVTLAGASFGVNYSSETGHISVRAGVKVLFVTKYYTFTVGYLKNPPPVYLAGNADDQSGTAFRGGELYLNMGERAEFRGFALDEVNEFFAVEYLGASAGSGHKVRIHGMGATAVYEGVERIVVDGGDGSDQIVILDGSEAQDLRVMKDGDRVKIVSYSGDVETPPLWLANVEAITLSGGDGANQFSIAGELDLVGVTTGVMVDMGSGQSGQLPDGAPDELTLTLGDSADQFELSLTNDGIQGIWKNHFTIEVRNADATGGDKINISTGGGDDLVTVYFDPREYGTYPLQGGPVDPQEVQEFYLTKDGSQFGPIYAFEQIENLRFGGLWVVDSAADENDGDFLAGDLSLREAIELANAHSGTDKIIFPPRLAGSTITLLSPAALVGLYTFDSGFDDHSGNGKNPVAVNNVDLVTGLDGMAAVFNGADSYIDVPIGIDPAVMPQLTMGAWVKSDVSTGDHGILSHDNGGWDRAIGAYSGHHVAFDGYGTPASHANLTTDWQFVAVVYDGRSIRHYVDGILKETVDRTGDNVGTDTLRIGGLPSNPNWDWDGLIDNVFVFSGALSAGEIHHIRTQGVNGILNLQQKSISDTVLEVWDFETGDLTGWNIVDTQHGDNAVFATPGNMPTTLPADGTYDETTVQRTHFIRTWDGNVLGNSDAHTGIIESDEFVLAAGARFDLLVGGGNHPFAGDPDNPLANITAVNLERKIADGDWEMIFTASGLNQNALRSCHWDASAYADQTVRLRIYDTHSGGWGHIAVDDIRYTAYSVPFVSGRLQITDNLTIEGLGAEQLAISGDGKSGIIRVHNESAAIDVAISGLSLIEGAGGNGGGIDNRERLAIEACVFSDNSAISGGGIYNSGSLTVADSTLADNSATSGGGIYNSGSLTVANSTLSGNSATGDGGGIYNSRALTVKNSTLADNSATSGGGVYSSAALTVANSTLSGNSATGDGGGIFCWAIFDAMTVTSSTFARNTAGDHGGGIYKGGLSTLTLKNSLLGGNTAPLGPDLLRAQGTITARHSLVQNGANSGIVNGVDGNRVGVDPLLDAAGLLHHGGPTKTIALRPGSPAINAGDNAAAAGLATDQRGEGFARVFNGAVDIGAFEFQLIVSTLVDKDDGNLQWGELSLREALRLAKDNPGHDQIRFAPELAGRTVAINSQLNINSDLELVGLDNTLDAGSRCRVLAVPLGVTATMRDVTINGGYVPADHNGGGVHNEGTLTVVNSTISNNRATLGGGIYNHTNGTLTVVNSTIAQNVARSHGGGIDNHGASFVVNSTISGNSAAYSGGGMLNWDGGTLLVTNSTIVSNTADADNDGGGGGGGIRTPSGSTTTLHNTIVAGNVRRSVDSLADELNGSVDAASSYNLIGHAASSGGLVHGVKGNQVGVDPRLDPDGLQDNGGPTKTIALLPGSPAINAGQNELAVDSTGNSLAFDQRGSGFSRIVRATVDIGSFEVQNVAPTATFSHAGPITYGETAVVAFADPFDPSADDTTAGFHYAYATSSAGLDGVTYASGSTEATYHFTGLQAGRHTLYARIIDKEDGYTQYTTVVHIEKAALTVTADAQTKTYGEADPALTYQITVGSLVTGDAFTGALARVAGEDVGTYPIMLGTLAAGANYELTFVGGDLTITYPVPIVTWFSATPNPVPRPDEVTMTAEVAVDPRDAVLQVEFYHADEMISTDVDGTDGWTAVVSTAGWKLGEHTVWARAQNVQGDWSERVAAMVMVRQGTFVDTSAPVAAVTANDVTESGGTAYQFTVNYSDDLAVDVSMLGDEDLCVRGPNSYYASAMFVSVTQRDNSPQVTATYEITAPGGGWDAVDSGIYEIWMLPLQTGDLDHNYAAFGRLGTLAVTIDPSQVGDVPDEAVATVSDDRFELVDGQLRLRSGESLAGGEPTVTVMLSIPDLISPGNDTPMEIPVSVWSAPWQNPAERLDVSRDGFIRPLDALLIINELNAGRSGVLRLVPAGADVLSPYLDVTGDHRLSPLDALLVINRLNEPSGLGGEGEAYEPSNALRDEAALLSAAETQWLLESSRPGHDRLLWASRSGDTVTASPEPDLPPDLTGPDLAARGRGADSRDRWRAPRDAWTAPQGFDLEDLLEEIANEITAEWARCSDSR